jgi:hypothetical protein
VYARIELLITINGLTNNNRINKMTNKKFNIRTLNKLFNQSGIEIIQGNGYCYFTSSNNASEEIKNKIASLYNSSVPINKISSISYNE